MSLFEDTMGSPNIPFPTLGGKVFWNELERQGRFVLQQNIVTKHCRILNTNNIRVGWGSESDMRERLECLLLEPGVVFEPKERQPQYGDIIGVHRLGGVYDHYGIYESDDCIYEYAAHGHDFGEADIHVTTLKKFIRDSGNGNLFILTFPNQNDAPVKSYESASAADPLPHFYTPEETVRRAKSRLGETKYSLLFNNCEHFAIWCKTGVHESHQANEILGQAAELVCRVVMGTVEAVDGVLDGVEGVLDRVENVIDEFA